MNDPDPDPEIATGMFLVATFIMLWVGMLIHHTEHWLP